MAPSRAPLLGVAAALPRHLGLGARGSDSGAAAACSSSAAEPMLGGQREALRASTGAASTSSSAMPAQHQRALPTRLTLPPAASSSPTLHLHHHHHHLIVTPAAGVMGMRPAPSTGPSAHSLLPFLAGSCFGALGLAVWQQSVQADNRPLQLPPGAVRFFEPPPGRGLVPVGDHSSGAQGPGTLAASSGALQQHQQAPTFASSALQPALPSQAPNSAWPLHPAWDGGPSSQGPPTLPAHPQQESGRGDPACSTSGRSAAWPPPPTSHPPHATCPPGATTTTDELRLERVSWPWARAWDTGGASSSSASNAPHRAPSPLRHRGVSSPDALPPAGGAHALPDAAAHAAQLPRPGHALGAADRPPPVPEPSAGIAAALAGSGSGSGVASPAAAVSGAGSVLAAALAAATGTSPFGSTNSNNVGAGAGSSSWSEPLTRGSISAATAAASPAVVHIVVAPEGTDLLSSSAAPISHAARYRSSSGSGFIYHPDGYVLTNAHVVASAVPAQALHGGSPGAAAASPPPSEAHLQHASHAATGGGAGGKAPQTVSMTLSDGRVLRGRVVALDRESDVAVLRAEELAPGERLPAVSVGRSSRLRAGEWVVALGTPLMLKQSVTAGIVSCVERRGHELGLEGARTAYIQTDAAINQGNSGGPLVNLDGQVVGMSVFKAVAADGVSFAIPMDTVCEIVRQLHEHGRVIRPYVGVTLVEVSNGALKQLQEQVPQLRAAKAAVVIQAVKEGSPAQVAGLQAEDIIIALDGHPCASLSEMVEAFGRSVGRPLSVGVIRQLPGSGQPQLLTKQLTPVEAAPTTA